MSGIFGGMVSSTAVTIAVGRIAGTSPERSSSALQASILAGSMSYFRVLILVWVVNAGFVPLLWWKLTLLALIGLALSVKVTNVQRTNNDGEVPGLQNPFEIRPAVGFALLFVLLTVITMFVRRSLGDSGILALSAIVGVTDITPFILSIVHGTDATLKVLTMAVILATMSNTIAKGVYFVVLSRSIRSETVWRYGVWALLHIPLLFI